MPEFIERAAVLEEIESLTITINGMRSGKTVLSEALKAYRAAVLSEISEAPTADVEPVVRCESCKFWKEDYGGEGKCKRNNGVRDAIFYYDDFCSYGEWMGEEC